jgi:chromosome segregation ATPase
LLARVERLSVSEWVEEENGSSRHSALKKTDTQKEAEHEKETKKLKKQLGDANETIQELEKELKEATQHVAQTPQFQSMKKMVAQKNEQLQRLRDRLQRYEPFEGEIEDE